MKKITLLVFLFSLNSFGQEENYSVKNLDVNTEYSDFGTTYMGDSTVIYASTKKISRTIGKRVWKQNMQPYLELYSGKISSDGAINDSENFSDKINTRYHESNLALTKDLKTVYFSANNYNQEKKLKRAKEGKDKGWALIQLYKGTVEDNGEWSNITPMPFNNDNYQTGHPSLNDAENKLYFTSDMIGGYGMTDIYVVNINEDGTYGEPENLGPKINTENREMFPFISNDNVLYFSSDGQENTLGELDIYRAKIGKDNKYLEPENLGTPLNSAKDDFGITYRSGKKIGYFSSNRDGGKGDDDIYYFEELLCSQIFQGTVRDKKNNALLPQSYVFLYKDGEKVESLVVGNDASFKFVVDCDSGYKVIVEKEYFTQEVKEFKTSDQRGLQVDLNFRLKIKEEFVEVGEKTIININPIYFDLNKSNIRPDAILELIKVINIMKKYPKLIIEGGSHTDSRASHSYNEALSLRRANSTVDYIIRNGIDSNRIFAKGYGELQLVNGCAKGVKCTEEEHQLNRRTEFVIKNPEIIKK
jgi:outer membrane protein OmpA-like peptidoglycan-associated protein